MKYTDFSIFQSMNLCADKFSYIFIVFNLFIYLFHFTKFFYLAVLIIFFGVDLRGG